MDFRIVWWNTHLRPPKGASAASVEHIEQVAQYILILLEKFDVDAVCLGEIGPAESNQLTAILEGKVVALLQMEGKEGQVAFNMAFVFRRDRLEIASCAFEYDVIAGSKSKIASRLQVLLEDRAAVTIFVVHWTSRLYENSETEKRSHLANSLRHRVDAILDVDENAQIILLGDFNDEPYDLSISKYLMASRDIHSVKRNPRLLYNPFWRSMSPKSMYSHQSISEKNSGSYYHNSGKVNRWHVFDQIIFSSSFVGSTGWCLNEERTRIFDISHGFGGSLEEGGNFDHYPVIGAMERI